MKIAGAEAAYLREHYATRGAAFCAAALGLSVRQVHRRVQTLKLRKLKRWSEHDDRALRWMWESSTLAEVAKKLGRTPQAVYQRAKILGLGLGCPRGLEYLSHAAARVGYSVLSLRRILKWARVPLRRGNVNPSAKRRGTGRHNYVTWIVDPERVNEAVERWCAHETLHEAGQRTGICDEVLGRWLTADGRCTKPPGRSPWRVETTIVDEVVARELAAETMADIARRLGIHRTCVRRRLERAGLWVPRKGHRYPRTSVDVAMECI